MKKTTEAKLDKWIIRHATTDKPLRIEVKPDDFDEFEVAIGAEASAEVKRSKRLRRMGTSGMVIPNMGKKEEEPDIRKAELTA